MSALAKRIRIIAPSSPYKRDELEAGVKRLETRFKLEAQAAIVACDLPYINGSDTARTHALIQAMDDAEQDFIWAARGGYGITRLLHLLPKKLKPGSHPQLVGYSDATALMAYLWCAGKMESIHGPVVTQCQSLSNFEWTMLKHALDGQWSNIEYGKLDSLTTESSSLSGRFFPFNLATLTSLIGTPFLPHFSQAIVGLEEIGEKPYQIDRMLTQLLSSNSFDGVKGIVLGHFTKCIWTKHRIYRLVSERLSVLNIPIYAGLPFGHQARNLPLKFGGMARVENKDGHGRFTWMQ